MTTASPLVALALGSSGVFSYFIALSNRWSPDPVLPKVRSSHDYGFSFGRLGSGLLRRFQLFHCLKQDALIGAKPIPPRLFSQFKIGPQSIAGRTFVHL
jgi:hypothetical protein